MYPFKEVMKKKKLPFIGKTSVTFSPPQEPQPLPPVRDPPVHWTKAPPAHVQVTESLLSRAIGPQKLMEDREGLRRAYDDLQVCS